MDHLFYDDATYSEVAFVNMNTVYICESLSQNKYEHCQTHFFIIFHPLVVPQLVQIDLSTNLLSNSRIIRYFNF